MEIFGESEGIFHDSESTCRTFSSKSSSDSSQSEWLHSDDDLSQSSYASIEDGSENSSIIETNENVEEIDLTIPFYFIDGQQSNITRNGHLWFNNENNHYVFGFNPMSKFDLFRYNIFASQNIPVVARQEEHNLVTKYI